MSYVKRKTQAEIQSERRDKKILKNIDLASRKRISFRTTKENYKLLKNSATDAEKTINQILNELIETYLKK